MKVYFDLHKISRAIFLLIPLSLFFSERINTVLIILYGLTLTLQPDLKTRTLHAVKSKWVWPFLLLFVIHVLSLLWSENFPAGWFIVEKKASLLAIPLFIAMDDTFDKKVLHRALFSLLAGCFTAIWICVVIAAWEFVKIGDPSPFFYHNLSWPLNEFNAVYLSFYIFISLVSLNYLSNDPNHRWLGRPWVQAIVVITFLGGIILLSSKVFILLTACYLVILLVRNLRKRLYFNEAVFVWSLGLTVLLGSVLLPGYTWKRFDQILDSQFEVLGQDQFQWHSPFNGLTLRLLFLQFGWEILAENKALISGIGVGDTQVQIDATIKRHNLYHGNPSLGDKGYLGYNFHNQYMEFWVQAGLIGLLCWFWVIFNGFSNGLAHGWHYPLIYLTGTIVLFAFSECFMERQRGIVFVVYFLSIFQAINRK